MIATAKRLEGIGEYYFSQKLREIARLNAEGKKVINLGIGNPDLPPHPDVIESLRENSLQHDVHGYQGYKGSPVLRKAVSDWYHKWYNVELDPETEILPLIGSKEGIMHVCMTYLDAGDQALVPNPGYPTYSSAVKLAGGECISYELEEDNEWQPDLEKIERQIGGNKRVKMMFLNYPHMPTGQLPEMELFEKIVRFAGKHNFLICHDNPYSFILNESPLSLLAVKGSREVVIELNSLSKSHNMAGWRVGVLCGGKERVEEVLRFKSNMDSGMFLPVQIAAAKALQLGKEWHDELNRVYAERRKCVFELLELLGCTFSSRQAGLFVWAHTPDRYKDGFAMSNEILYNASVFITPGGIFGAAGDQYVRVSLCSSVERFGEAIERLQKLK